MGVMKKPPQKKKNRPNVYAFCQEVRPWLLRIEATLAWHRTFGANNKTSIQLQYAMDKVAEISRKHGVKHEKP
jgi:hypothetical protein